MCGIIGYSGPLDPVEVVTAGLTTLEYRGYDSAGIAVVDDRAGDAVLRTVRRAGKLSALTSTLEGMDLGGSTALGHTRWATHGAPTDRNAHPHTDAGQDVAVVHNGIIENHAELRAELVADGVELTSETDTEVVAHLMARAYVEDPDAAPGEALAAALRATVRRCQGAFAFAAVDRRHPGVLVAARRSAPVIIGHLDDAAILASDAAGLVAHTRELTALLDDQVAVLTRGNVAITDLQGEPAEAHRYTVDWDVDAASKAGYEHYMRKEIHEQPAAVRETLLGRVRDGRIVLDELREGLEDFSHISKVYVVACGTSYHAGLVAKYAIEHWAKVGCEVEIASEFRYRDPILDPHTLVVAISQSGETSDTLAAASHARDQQAPVVAITNVVGSSLAREADAVLFTRAGPEVAVASTKAFTTQIVALEILALYLAQSRRAMWPEECRDQLARMEALPAHLEAVLDCEPAVKELAADVAAAGYVMFIGRHVGLPIAYEGALKLKEISYLHAEGFASGEMKHGPIALIDQGGPVIALATQGHVYPKILANIAEVKARGAVVTAIATAGDSQIKEHAEHVIDVPEVHELLYPVLTVVPLQLLSYHVAVALGRDVDQPRNLAKTVTVE